MDEEPDAPEIKSPAHRATQLTEKPGLKPWAVWQSDLVSICSKVKEGGGGRQRETNGDRQTEKNWALARLPWLVCAVARARTVIFLIPESGLPPTGKCCLLGDW